MTPTWFSIELKAIHPKYFAVYDERQKQYEIRKWLGAYARPRTYKIDSQLICKISYDKLDRRILYDLREGLYWAKHAKELLRKVDNANQKLTENADIEHEYISRYMAKRIWHYYKEPIVFGGLKGTTDRRFKH